mgnify:CR=1 FL=1
MAKVSVYNIEGKEVDTIELNDAVFGVEVNEHLVHMAVVNQLANNRQGTQKAKTRSEVSGGGKKPWRQKGTGRARQGSIRSPQWTHGGIALGPKPRTYKVNLNKKVKRLAMKSAFSSKVAAEELVVLDDLKLDAIKTKEVVKVLTALETGKKVLLVLPENNDVLYRSARNIAGVKVSTVNTLNVYDILNCDTMLVLKDSVAKIEEVYA